MLRTIFICFIILISILFSVSSYYLRDDRFVHDKIMEVLKLGNNDVELEFEYRSSRAPVTRPVGYDSRGYRRYGYYEHPASRQGRPISRNDLMRLKSMLRDEEINPEKPVLMKDLQEALTKLENRIRDTINNVTGFENKTTVDELEHEATKPVYMKDLWKYFGKNFLNNNADSDCDDQGGIEDLIQGNNGNLNNVIQLLSKATGVKAIGSELPKDKDISWVKVKVPK